jgi:hypothetical protein
LRFGEIARGVSENGNAVFWSRSNRVGAKSFGVTVKRVSPKVFALGGKEMKMFFGPRWAYHLQDQILGERLDGLVFPSRSVAESRSILYEVSETKADVTEFGGGDRGAFFENHPLPALDRLV